MRCRTINTQEDPIRNRRPCRILRIAIKAHLVLGLGFELPENGILVGETVGGHGCREEYKL